MMRASLPMYDRPELENAHRAYWSLIRDALRSRGLNAPETLTANGVGLGFWRSNDVVLSQTCGLPFRTWLHRDVQLVGTPDFGLEGCTPGYYRSVIVTHKDDLRAQLSDYHGGVLAINGTDSQSGYAAFLNHTAKSNLSRQDHFVSGSHRASAQAVAEKQADLAALDAISWRLIKRWDRFSDQLRVLEMTVPTPGLPYICATDIDPTDIADAVRCALAASPKDARDALGIKALINIPKADYLAVPIPEGTT